MAASCSYASQLRQLASAPVTAVQMACLGAVMVLLVDLCASGDGTRAIVPEMMAFRGGRGLFTGPVWRESEACASCQSCPRTASPNSRVLRHVATRLIGPNSASFAHFVSENSALVHAVDAAAVPVAVLHRGAAHTPPPPRHRPHRCRIPRRNTSSRTTVSQHDLDHGLGPQQGPEARRGHAHQ